MNHNPNRVHMPSREQQESPEDLIEVLADLMAQDTQPVSTPQHAPSRLLELPPGTFERADMARQSVTTVETEPPSAPQAEPAVVTTPDQAIAAAAGFTAPVAEEPAAPVEASAESDDDVRRFVEEGSPADPTATDEDNAIATAAADLDQPDETDGDTEDSIVPVPPPASPVIVRRQGWVNGPGSIAIALALLVLSGFGLYWVLGQGSESPATASIPSELLQDPVPAKLSPPGEWSREDVFAVSDTPTGAIPVTTTPVTESVPLPAAADEHEEDIPPLPRPVPPRDSEEATDTAATATVPAEPTQVPPPAFPVTLPEGQLAALRAEAAKPAPQAPAPVVQPQAQRPSTPPAAPQQVAQSPRPSTAAQNSVLPPTVSLSSGGSLQLQAAPPRVAAPATAPVVNPSRLPGPVITPAPAAPVVHMQGSGFVVCDSAGNNCKVQQRNPALPL